MYTHVCLRVLRTYLAQIKSNIVFERGFQWIPFYLLDYSVIGTSSCKLPQRSCWTPGGWLLDVAYCGKPNALNHAQFCQQWLVKTIIKGNFVAVNSPRLRVFSAKIIILSSLSSLHWLPGDHETKPMELSETCRAYPQVLKNHSKHPISLDLKIENIHLGLGRHDPRNQ